MTKWEEKEKKKDMKYISVYYDIETTQCDAVEGKPDTYEHKPNLLVSQAVCEQCDHVAQNDYFCNVCQTRQHIFHNLDDPNLNVMAQFFDYLKSNSKKSQILLIAHNAKAFDAVFALQEVVGRKLKPELILQGAKILCMTVGNWKWIDSLSFLPMPLSAMPKSFGLHELKKGYWPYLANKPEFYQYEGPMLDKDYYCVSSMKRKAAADFNTWYDEQVADNFVFNFRRELIDYCVSDVTILRQACQSFRKLFSQTAGFDPMAHCITLSSACMAAYRRNFLPENKIGIVPAGGYHGRGKQSHIALKWLDFEAHKLGRKIKTIYTDREVSVLGRRVDGYVEIPKADGTNERRIYQFHGCYWHQCPKHYPANGDSGENRYENTMRLTALFRREGYVVIEKWECAFTLDLENDAETKAYFQAHPTTRTPPLVLRDALAGGRTSALRWYHKADLEKGEKIKMADVISEYPNANLRGKYPYGHPEIFLQGDPLIPPVDQWNGVIKCTVLPPRDLFLPVLPYKCNGRLMFPLCRTCADMESKELYRHEDPTERRLTGTWCAPELQLALEKGYKIVEVHEVYQYPGTMQFDPETGEDGLLSGYVRCFMALKIQASGWPAGCDTEEQKNKFIQDVLRFDGVNIDATKMEKNTALMDFYALLPSNAIPDVYPENKTSHFTIELSKRMELHGQWQAALIEFHYPNTIEQVIQGENEITIQSDRMLDIFFIKPGCYPSTTGFVSALSEAVTPFEEFTNQAPQKKIIEETADHRILIQPFDHSPNTKYTFSPRLALQLGLEGPGPFPANQQLMGVKPIDMSLGIPSQMYVYMDILTDQIVGHTRAPLLRTVPVNIKETYGSMSIFYCKHPIYFDLNTKSFDTLKIDIRDHAGRLVPFDYGTSTLLVHFKQQ